MNKYTRNEIAVGSFVLVGLAGLAYLSVSIGGLELWGPPLKTIHARFASVGDLKDGASVKMAGVRVGSVDNVRLERYAAEVDLHVRRDLVLPKDTIASIRTEGLLGESYVLLRPGGAEEDLVEGDHVSQTEPAVDLIDLLVRYALQSDDEGGGASDDNSTDEPSEGGGFPDLFE
ncbi:MAG: outer membrane lipid asymmetry maintenance protein MlaD [Myxococcales bacterium]|nr:outer membrane lipid asymmetry maintenance protein MlaD [Myxococcales bacterium]